ncbi:hypothetical protein [Leptotrichia shahii]|uniref:hypothetical protein n=1 Tax=Leptotrichia shahii TaxID=157691 RepID=UPI0028D07A4D|nr:hypothetical protein [Leptotrichia shahii]
MMNRKEEYKYIWKVIQDIRNNSQKIENIKFLIPKEKISSYMELNDGKLNAIEIDKNEIEVNPYVRFNSIFNSLNDYLIEEEEILEKAINNIMFHLLAEVDLQEGINYKYVILKKYIELMENGYFGEFVKNNIKYFSKTEKMKIARYLKVSYETDDSLYVFCKILKIIFKDSIFYRYRYEKKKYLFYINAKKNKANKRKVKVLAELFLPMEYFPKVMWEYHIGVIGVEETLKIGEMLIM